MDRLADQLFILTGDGEVKMYAGSYTDYREEEKELKKIEVQEENKKASAPVPKAAKVANPSKQKISYKEKFEFESLEKEIDVLEKKKAALLEQLNNATTSHDELLRITTEFGDIAKLIDAKQFRWLELSELIG